MRTLPLRFWLSLTLSLLVLVPAGARAADPIRIWVDNALTIDDSESADGVASCPALATPPTTQTVNAGTSSRKRLRGVQTASGYMYGLNYALKCIHDTRDWDTRDVEVYVVCKNGGKVANDPLENPNAKPRCEYSNLDNTLNPLLFGHTPSSTRPAVTGKRLLRAEPEDSVKLALHTTIRVYDNWTIQGVRFDGSRVPDGGAQSTTWINLLGSNIRFERNSVIEMRGSCIRVGDNVYNSIPKNVTLAYNHVEGCYARPLNHEDRHCIFTYQADNLNVLFNEMTRCQGDGFQTLNHEQPTPAELAGATDAGVRKANFNTVATGTRVVGNRIWTSCQNYKGPDGVERGYTLGENAIDIKRTGLGLLIQDNLMHGFRSSGATDCPSFTETTSYLNGSAIVMHGTIENDSAAQVDWQTAALNPECTLAERDDAGTRCAVVEGNDISESGMGISVGSNINIGNPPRGVIVRGNFIHDLRGAVGDKGDAGIPAKERGTGMLLTQSDATQDVPNLVYRNTLANIPGESFHLSANHNPTVCASRPSEQDRYYCRSDSRNFVLRNNLIAWTGSQLSNKAGDECRAPLASQSGGLSREATYFHDALNLPTDTDRADPVFMKPYGTHPSAVTNSCGVILPALSTATPGFHDVTYGTQQYDYRLSRSSPSPAENPVSDVDLSTLYTERHSGLSGYCGSGPDLGADEKCPTQLVYLEEHPSSLSRANEEFNGLAENPWESRDISVIGKDTRPGGLDPDEITETNGKNLPYHEPYWDAESEILIRVRSQDGSSLPAGTPVQIRVFQGRPHTNFIFPRDFQLVTDKVEVPWRACTGSLPCSGPGWRSVGNSADGKISVYAFPWKPRAFYRTDAHSCLRAELSIPQDPRPPFFTHITQSNNLAQRNLFIKAQGEEIATYSVMLAPRYELKEQGQSTESRRLQLLFRTQNAQRNAWFYVPPSEAQRFVNDGTQSFPPAGAQPLSQMDDTLFFQSLPTNRHTFAQILVDSRTAGPPSPADFVWLKDAYGFVQVNLLAPGFRTSFEWGLPTGWTASGGWRVTDMATEGAYCGSNHTGRRAMAFNNASGCTYSGLGTGTLTSPVITVPCQRDVAFYFWHWSSTRRDYPDFDKRRVMLSVDGGLFFTVYESGARDTGDFDSWKQQRIDLSAYTNRQVQVRFEFQPYYSGTVTQTGWYIDDVEVK